MPGEAERTMRLHRINRTIKRCTITVLSGAALLFAGCEQAVERALPTVSPPSAGPQADLSTSDLLQLLLKFEPISDGTLTLDDPPPLGTAIHVVDRDNMDAWKIDVPTAGGAVTFEDDRTCDRLNTPLPPGALHLVVFPGDAFARLRDTRYHRTYLHNLTRLDYYACDEMNNGQQWPFIILNIDWNGDNVIDDLIFFEPAYQNTAEGGDCGTSSAQGPEMPDKWQFWNALKIDATGDFLACYWALSSPFVGGTGTVGCGPGTNVCSLSNYIMQHPNAAIVNLDGNDGGVQVVHGFADPMNMFNGWVDAFSIGKNMNNSNSTITYDFQAP
jgi:hypothetical protein